MRTTKWLRSGGMFLGHLLAALIGTGIFESEIYRIFAPSTSNGRLLKATILSAAIAFALGYFVFWKWRSQSAKWLWIIGLCWFGQRAVRYWIGQSSLRLLGADHSV